MGFSYSGLVNPSAKFKTLTPSDSEQLTEVRSLYIQASGNVVATDIEGNQVTFAVTVGQVLPIQPKFLNASTTATVIGLG